MKNLCIVGCGYVGSELAKCCSQKGYHVTATTRHMKRLNAISKFAQKGVVFKGANEEELTPLVSMNEILVVTIAPDSPEQYSETYLHNANLFRQIALKNLGPRKLLYTSSTSIYGDHHGLWVDETSPILGKSDQAKILIETENVYLSLIKLGWTVCILRLSEIYGPEKEISSRVKQLQGHKMPGSGEMYTNMIHLDDVVGGIEYALRHDCEGVYNLSDDDHPTRKDLYETISKKYHLAQVEWDPTHPPLRGDNKRVSNHKIKGAGFSLSHPHRVLI